MIDIDLEKAAPKALLELGEVIEALIPEVMHAVHGDIIHKAEQLNTGRQAYLEGLKAPEVNPGAGTATIALEGLSANLVERGWGGGPMAPALVRGRAGRQTESGERYAIVPIVEEDQDSAHAYSGDEAAMRAMHPRKAEARKKRGSQRRPSATSFRTVTERSGGFVHPGIEPAHILDEAGSRVGELFNDMLQQALEKQ